MFHITKEQIDDFSLQCTRTLPGKDFNYDHFTGQPASSALIDELLHALQPYSQKYHEEYDSLQAGATQAQLLEPGVYRVK